MDMEAWHAAVHGVTKSQRWLSGWTELNRTASWRASLVAQLVKNLPAVQETGVWSLVWEDPLEKGKATHSSILAWRTPWIVQSTWGYKESDMATIISLSLPLGRKAMTNLVIILKSRAIALPTKVCIVKSMILPVVMYICESWTIKKSECWRIDAFKLWSWGRFLRVPWTARSSN